VGVSEKDDEHEERTSETEHEERTSETEHEFYSFI